MSAISPPSRTGPWNLVRGIALSGLTALPPVLAARYMGQHELVAWVVAFSLLPWLLVSQVGLQPGVLALVGGLGAHAPPSRKAEVAQVALKSSAAQYILIASVAGITIALVHSASFIPDSLERVLDRPDVLIVLLTAGLLQALGSVGNAYMLAVGRASVMAGLTLIGAAAFLLWSVIAITSTPGLTAMGLSIALCVGMSAPAIGAIRNVTRSRRPGRSIMDNGPSSTASVRTQLNRFMAAQAIWVVPGLLVSGLDNILVAEFEPSALRMYSASLALLTLTIGAIGALASPYISHFSELATASLAPGARRFHQWNTLEPLLLRLSWLAIIGSFAGFLLALLPLVVLRQPALPLGASATRAVLILSMGVSIRVLTVPLATVALSTRRQRSLFPSAVSEATVNAVASIGLGYRFGAVGVAVGTLLGSLTAVACHGWAAARPLKDVPISGAWWLRTVLAPSTFIVILGSALAGVLGE